MGLGTSEMGNVEAVVYASIRDGARLIDTAAMYGNEEEDEDEIQDVPKPIIKLYE